MDVRVIVLLILEGVLAYILLGVLGCLQSYKEKLESGLLIFLALFVRLCFFDRENTDYEWFLKVWINFFRENGGLAGLGYSLGNYNVPYLVLLSAFSYSSIYDLYLIKLLSVFFDVILAFAAALIVEHCGGNREKQMFCFFAVLFLPTVVLNSSFWGQCDSIYVSFALLGIAAALTDAGGKGHPALSVIFAAISFSFKLQAVFVIPVWVVIWIWKKYELKWLALFPLTYIVMMLPAIIAGRPFYEVLLFYADQADTVGSALNYNSPSLTALLKGFSDTESVSRILILCAFLAMIAIIVFGIIIRKRLKPDLILVISAMMSIAIPFLLPHMHDRYFYAADILSLILAILNLILIPAAAGIQFGSGLCYIAYFTGYYQRLGNSSIYLTNDKGAVAVLFSFIWITAFLLVKIFEHKDLKSQIV